MAGYYLGKLKFFHISLSLSAVLICAVFAGVLLSSFDVEASSGTFVSGMKTLSELGTALFVGSIGVSTGCSMYGKRQNKNGIYFLIGVLMVVIGFVVIMSIRWLDPTIDKSLLLGILCGAMTSTPGLSAVYEIEGAAAELAVLGYGCTYIFGVVGVVASVQLITMSKVNESFNSSHTLVADRKDGNRRCEWLVLVGVAVVLGCLCGGIEYPVICCSFGSSAGILCCGIMIGYLAVRVGKIPLDGEEVLSYYRNLGLLMFFVGSGLPSGMKIRDAFAFKWVFYGMLLTIIPIVFGYFISRFFIKKSATECACIISGGMTSTPAIGVILRNRSDVINLSAYSAAYLGALLTMTLGSKLLWTLL